MKHIFSDFLDWYSILVYCMLPKPKLVGQFIDLWWGRCCLILIFNEYISKYRGSVLLYGWNVLWHDPNLMFLCFVCVVILGGPSSNFFVGNKPWMYSCDGMIASIRLCLNLESAMQIGQLQCRLNRLLSGGTAASRSDWGNRSVELEMSGYDLEKKHQKLISLSLW